MDSFTSLTKRCSRLFGTALISLVRGRKIVEFCEKN